ncbi:hypothetical protein CK203_060991 [Vitis vinifera]|uniref:Retrotransposon gag domain-containing protein n=1 Tax=Vitis vinifera TaxID=29760 RepID=A0A438G6L3_VITVI|nr:hypothetical protein CK203_060991 [Vitis vinifera]
MVTPSRSHSSGRREEDNSEWRQAIERRQLASERQLQALLQETVRLREEKEVLHIQASSTGSPCQQRSRGQVANSRLDLESIYPGTAGAIPETCNAPRSLARPRPPVVTTWGTHPDPMVTPMARNVPLHPDPMVTSMAQNVPPYQVVRQIGRNLPNEPPVGSISKRLDDMLSTPFCSHIIHYEPPRGFLVPKFSLYDGSNDPFDHIMHYRQLMTLDIGNVPLLCKVFPVSLQGQTLSWFHRLPLNSVDNFRTCWKPSWDNTYALLDKSRTSALCRGLQHGCCPADLQAKHLSRHPIFSNHSLKSLLQRWTTCSEVQTNTQCSKMTYEQPPSKSWLPDRHPKVVRKEVPNFRTGQGRGLDPRNGPIQIIVKECAFHKEHGYTTEACRCLHYLVERLIKARHLKQYFRSDARGGDASRNHNSGTPKALAALKPL